MRPWEHIRSLWREMPLGGRQGATVKVPESGCRVSYSRVCRSLTVLAMFWMWAVTRIPMGSCVVLTSRWWHCFGRWDMGSDWQRWVPGSKPWGEGCSLALLIPFSTAWHNKARCFMLLTIWPSSSHHHTFLDTMGLKSPRIRDENKPFFP